MQGRGLRPVANQQFLAGPKFLGFYYDRMSGRELVPRETQRVHSCAVKESGTTQAELGNRPALLGAFRLRREEEPE